MDIVNLEHDLRTYRPSGYEGLPEEFVWPRYEGLSVGNLPATVVQLLGGQAPHLLPPLRSDLLEGLTDGVRRVVLVLLDALGWEQLHRMMAADPDLIFHDLAARGRLLPLTTVFPSTTTNVLSTLRTGMPPVRHGLLAYELFLREWEMAVECITFSPRVHKSPGLLEAWGMKGEDFLPVPSLAQLLSVQGVLTEYVIASHIAEGVLSRMFYRGVRKVHKHHYAADFWLRLRRVLQDHPGDRFFLSGYWSAVDTLGHHYGPEDETALNELRSISFLLKRSFLGDLTPVDREGTLLLITADHGQVPTSLETAVLLEEHPLLRDSLIFAPLGEARVPFFYARAGSLDRVRSYIQEHFADQLVLFDRAELLRSGLLGPGEPYAEIPHRLGDLVAVMRGNGVVVDDKEDAKHLAGRHGGMQPEEMLVPLLAVRLDA